MQGRVATDSSTVSTYTCVSGLQKILLWAVLWLLMSWTMNLCNCCAMQKATMWQFQPLDAEMFILNLQQYVSSANKRSWEDDCSLIAHQLGHNHSQVRWHILLITYIDRFYSIYINIKLICFITCTHAGTCSANNSWISRPWSFCSCICDSVGSWWVPRRVQV